MRRIALVLGLLVTGAAPAHARPGDWAVERDPFDRSLIARYKQLLERAPHDRMALSALVSLYKRHRTISLLVREYMAAPDRPSRNIVLARLARQQGDLAGALDLYARAIAANDKDALSWHAVGELRRGSDKAGARVAFERAAALSTAKASKQAALRELVRLAVDARDGKATEAVFDALTALAPRDGKLWAERGDALLELKQFDAAIAAYAKAETLFTADPERRLAAIAARGTALDRAGKPDAAVAELDRAIQASPRGYYLRNELVLRIVEVRRRHRSLADAIADLEKRWPENKRGHFEWVTLATLHEDARDIDRMIDALRRATRADPADTRSQWKLIQHFDRTHRPELAFKQLQAAAAASPTDASLQLELAQRVKDEDNNPLAFSILERLSRAQPRDAGTHRSIAEVYLRWDQPENAIRELKLAARIEPEAETLVMLGDALLSVADISGAVETWDRIATSGTPEALQRLGDVLADRDFWEEAAAAYTKAMFKGGKDAKLWAARGHVHAELAHWDSAVADAEHAVALLGPVDYDVGFDVRMNLVRILNKRAEDLTEGPDALVAAEKAWQAAFAKDPPAVAAGYLLVAFYARTPERRYSDVIEKLRTLAPHDRGLVPELVRSYRVQHRYREAIALARSHEMREIAATIEIDQQRAAERERLALEDPPPMHPSITRTSATNRRIPLKMATRFGLGFGVGGATERTISLSSWDAFSLSRHLDVVARAGWSQHLGQMKSVHAGMASVGIGAHRKVTPSTAVMVVTSTRAELRLGDLGPWERWAFAADVGLDVTHRALPVTLGLRYEQGLSAPGSTLMLELSAGWRCGIFSGGSGACR